MSTPLKILIHALAVTAVTLGCSEAQDASEQTHDGTSAVDIITTDVMSSEDATSGADNGDVPDGKNASETSTSADGDTAGDTVTTTDSVEPKGPPAWDPSPAPVECTVANTAPLLDNTLELAGLTQKTFTFTKEDYKDSGYYAAGLLDDPFLLTWFRPVQAAPAESACFVRDKAAVFDDIAAGAHPVAAAIRHTAALVERWEDGDPIDPAQYNLSLPEAIAAACEVIGKTYNPKPIDLPEELQQDLVPIIIAMTHGLKVHQSMVASAKTGSPQDWFEKGQPGVLVVAPGMDVQDPNVRDYLLGADIRPKLNLAAAQIAFAIESVDWSKWRDKEGISLELSTPLGWIRIRDGKNDEYPETNDVVWLLLDLGGDDTYLERVGANTHWQVGVNVAIDLGGNDTYAYPEVKSPFDKPWLLPADEDGRLGFDTNYGPITLSLQARQGAARNGIAFLFDFGTGNDTYKSLAMSQGYAHLGVGVLYDEGGDDLYQSEIGSQGSAGYGIGLLMDQSGNDKYEMFSRGQGFGYVAGGGVLYDGDGDDIYFSNPGKKGGGHTLYFSPQMPQTANSAFTQGAGFGMRRDDLVTFWSGGIGILRDKKGNDKYTSAVFGQGTGYWQGTGILSDGDGQDEYDAFWYVQGGSAHYAIGILMDGGQGGDKINQNIDTMSMQVGAGHDYSLGVFVNEAGDDVYTFGGLAVGASNCNGIGLFVDNAGNDQYSTESDYNTGLGNVGGECLEARPNAISIGIMMDAGGTDNYTYPESNFPIPADNTTFGHVTHDLPSEHGAGQDTEGETGIHAP